jgi:hypothetical protein
MLNIDFFNAYMLRNMLINLFNHVKSNIDFNFDMAAASTLTLDSVASSDSEFIKDSSKCSKDETSTISTANTSLSALEILETDDSTELNDKSLDRLISERHKRVTTSIHIEENDHDDRQSKFKALFGLLKNFIGVKDIVTL